MFTIKSLRAKTVLSALVPTALVLVVVAIIALYAYERVARDVVRQRDTELARVSAARLSEGLNKYSRRLQDIAAQDDVRSMEPSLLSAVLEKAQDQPYVFDAFDAGVVVYNSEGIALWAPPFGAERRGTDFPVPSQFDEVRRTGEPVFSNVFQDAVSGEHIILVGVPIAGSSGEFKGVLAGMSTIRYSLIGVTYAEVLELKAGRSGYAYLVDGNGRVIYHRNSSQLGRNLAATVPVMRAIRGETDAVLTEDLTGERVISGFAPVPGTGWAVITQERWANVVGPMRGWSRLVLGLLVVGGVISSALILLAIGRILKPIKDLTQGAQRIAGGDFEHTIAARTGDEIQALAQQFNIMAGALKESYTDLEQKVTARTEEVRQAEQRYRHIFENAIEGMYQTTLEGQHLTANPALARIYGYDSPEELSEAVTDIENQIYVDPGRRAEFIRLMEKDGSVWGFESRAYCKDGSVIWISENARAERDEREHLLYYEGTLIDITERKQAEEAARQAEEKYRNIFENAIEGIYQSTPEGRIITANPAMAHMFGYESPEELLATLTDLTHQLFVEPSRREEALRLLDEHGAISGFEFQVYRKDGGVIWVSEVARLVRDESGAVLYYEGAIEDITQRKQAEEALFQQTKEMAVLEERSRMAGEIHDTLAQGFTGIVLQLEAAEQALDESPTEAPGHLSRAKSLARESLQEARRSVWGLLPHALEERPLDAALKEEVRRFSAAGREKASFSLSGSRRELPSNVQAALLRICQESLTNIRRHATATEVKVALTFYPEAVCLGVRDNGVGFDPEAVKGRGRQGGFGLTGMEERARRLRGTLEVGSREGKGTLVEVKIPTAW